VALRHGASRLKVYNRLMWLRVHYLLIGQEPRALHIGRTKCPRCGTIGNHAWQVSGTDDGWVVKRCNCEYCGCIWSESENEELRRIERIITYDETDSEIPF